MTILIIAEHDNGSLKAATLNTVTAAAVIATVSSHDVHILVAGSNARGAAEAAAQIAGVSKVYWPMHRNLPRDWPRTSMARCSISRKTTRTSSRQRPPTARTSRRVLRPRLMSRKSAISLQ